MSEQQNLARVWRSKTFDEVVGQELTIRILKNSLYRRRLFPVYLLAGQRGCGKTTVGRLFAAAVNCEQYEGFCARPREVTIPCAQCQSCLLIRQGAHPDCIEIDAASHTGVDHVRSLIDSSTLLPVLGRKKIYLIDEVHMLSKAAFNALLKVLEEPPASVIFVLATTDPQKVLETVRSRCFQLFFTPVKTAVLVAHLARVCAAENIAFDEAGLRLVAHEAEGSVRDALNGVERVFLACGTVTHEAACAALGDLGADVVCTLCILALTGSVSDVLRALEQEVTGGAVSRMWGRITDMFRTFLLLRAGMSDDTLSPDQIAAVKTVSMERIIGALEIMYEVEPLLAKTSNQRVLLELVLVRIARQTSQGQLRAEPVVRLPEKKHDERTAPASPTPSDTAWERFIALIQGHDDPLALSVMRQGELVEKRGQEIVVKFATHLAFFKDTLEAACDLWRVHVEAIWGAGSVLLFQFDKPLSEVRVQTLLRSENFEGQAVSVPQKQVPEVAPQAIKIAPKGLDVRNKNEWPLVHQVLELFPGTVTEDTGERYE